MILVKQVDYILQQIRDIEKLDSDLLIDDDNIISKIIELKSAVSNLRTLDIPTQKKEIIIEIKELPEINVNISAIDSRTWAGGTGLGVVLHLINRIRRRRHLNRLFKTLETLEKPLLRIKSYLERD